MRTTPHTRNPSGGSASGHCPRAAEAAQVIKDERFAPLGKLQELNATLKEVRFRLAGVLLDQMPVVGSRIHLKETMAKAPALWKAFKDAAGHLGGEGGAIVAGIDRDFPLLERFALDLDKAYESNDRRTMEALLEERWPAMQQSLVKPLDALLPSLAGAVAQETADLEASARRFRKITATVALLGVAATIATIVLLLASLTSGLRETLAAAKGPGTGRPDTQDQGPLARRDGPGAAGTPERERQPVARGQ
jgi:methyl-accepting chemotaxis protein